MYGYFFHAGLYHFVKTTFSSVFQNKFQIKPWEKRRKEKARKSMIEDHGNKKDANKQRKSKIIVDEHKMIIK